MVMFRNESHGESLLSIGDQFHPVTIETIFIQDDAGHVHTQAACHNASSRAMIVSFIAGSPFDP